MISQLETAASPPPAQSSVRRWFWATAALGTLWNAYGAYQFAQSVMATRNSMIAILAALMRYDEAKPAMQRAIGLTEDEALRAFLLECIQD